VTARYIQLEENPAGPVPDVGDVITDSDQVRVEIHTAARAVTILDKKCTGLALYSHLKDKWNHDNHLIQHSFPIHFITGVCFEMQDAWIVTNPDMLVFDVSNMAIGLFKNAPGSGVLVYQRTGMEAGDKDIRLG